MLARAGYGFHGCLALNHNRELELKTPLNSFKGHKFYIRNTGKPVMLTFYMFITENYAASIVNSARISH